MYYVKGNLDMGMVPCKDGNYVAIGHGMPKTASNYQSQRERPATDFLSPLQKDTRL